MLKYILLGYLNYRPMTGYEMKQVMDQSTVHFWHAKLSQIYVTFKALEAEALVTSTVEVQEERPDRRVYTITEAGRQDFHRWLSQPETELSPRKETLILKLFFSAQLERETILTQLHLQRDLHQRQVEYYREGSTRVIQQAAAQYPGLEKDAILWEATRRFGEQYEALYVAWLEEMISLVEQRF